MGVRFKLHCKNGVIGKEGRYVCWGFLSQGLKSLTYEYKERVTDSAYESYCYEREEWNEHAVGQETYNLSQLTSFTGSYGVDPEDMESGVVGMEVMMSYYNEYSIKNKDALIMKALRAMYKSYPKLFTCVDEVGTDSVYVNFDGYYANIYNTLRLLSSIKRAEIATLKEMIAHPELSPLLSNIYPWGEANLSEMNIFRLKDLSKKDVRNFIKRREWKFGRTTDRYNLLHRQSAKKHTNLAYVTPVHRVPRGETNYYSGYTSSRHGVLPKYMNDFITEFAEVKHG